MKSISIQSSNTESAFRNAPNKKTSSWYSRIVSVETGIALAGLAAIGLFVAYRGNIGFSSSVPTTPTGQLSNIAEDPVITEDPVFYNLGNSKIGVTSKKVSIYENGEESVVSSSASGEEEMVLTPQIFYLSDKDHRLVRMAKVQITPGNKAAYVSLLGIVPLVCSQIKSLLGNFEIKQSNDGSMSDAKLYAEESEAQNQGKVCSGFDAVVGAVGAECVEAETCREMESVCSDSNIEFFNRNQIKGSESNDIELFNKVIDRFFDFTKRIDDELKKRVICQGGESLNYLLKSFLSDAVVERDFGTGLKEKGLDSFPARSTSTRSMFQYSRDANEIIGVLGSRLRNIVETFLSTTPIRGYTPNIARLYELQETLKKPQLDKA